MTKFNTILVIVDILIILAALSFIMFKYFNEKLSYVKKVLDESEKDCIKQYKSKYEIIIKLIEITQNKYKIDSKVFEQAKSINEEDLNTYKDEKLLNKCFKEINQIKEDNSKVRETKNFKELLSECNKNEILLVSLRSYHNKYTLIYNNMIKKFPYNLISKIRRYKIDTLIEGNELETNFNNDVEV